MYISKYSIIMSIFYFSIFSATGCFILKCKQKGGLFLLNVIFILTFLRILLPLDFAFNYVIVSPKAYSSAILWTRKILWHKMTIGNFILTLWVLGIFLSLSRFIFSLYQQHQFRKQASIQSSETRISVLFRHVATEMSYSKPYTIATSPYIPCACQTGFSHLYILMPKDYDHYSDIDLTNMLRHELCHFQNKDLWIKFLFRLLSCILWWNPIMILLKNNLEQLLELHCDQKLCMGFSEEQQLNYLGTLLHVLDSSIHKKMPSFIGYSGQNGATAIKQRFQIILHQKNTKFSLQNRILICVTCSIAFLLSYFIVIQPAGYPPLEELAGAFEVSPETAYITCSPEGIYSLYLYSGNYYVGILSEEELLMPPHNTLQIFTQGENDDEIKKNSEMPFPYLYPDMQPSHY